MPWSTSTSTLGSGYFTPSPFATIGGDECNHCGNEHPTLRDAVLYHTRRASEWRMESMRLGSGILPSDVEKEDQLVKSLSMGLAPMIKKFPSVTKTRLAPK
jgi:hypothetical protein